MIIRIQDAVLQWLSVPALVLNDGARDEDIQHLCSRCNIRTLPAGFEALFREVDGFRNGCDERGFRFWPTEEMDLVSRYQRGAASFKGSDSFLLFADYLDWSWAYALCVGVERVGCVAIVGTRDGLPDVIAHDFAAFLEYYLNDEDLLYGT